MMARKMIGVTRLVNSEQLARPDAMHLSLERKTEIAIALMLVLLLGIGFVAYRSSTEFIASSAQVVHSREVRGNLQRILSLVEEIETGQRGYIITGESSFLEPYQRAADKIQERLAHVKTLTAHEPELRAQIETLVSLVNSRIAFAAESIDLRRSQGFAAAKDLLLSGKGQQDMERIRTLIIELREAEKVQLLEHSDRTTAIARSTITVAEASSLLAVVIVLIMGTVYRWGLAARRRTEQALQESLAKETLVMRALPVVIYSSKASEDFAALWVSHNVEKVSGFPGALFLTDPGLWAARIHPDDRERVLREFQRLPEMGTLHLEYRWQVADGTYRWFLDQALLHTATDGSSKEILGLWLDITERKAMDERLREVNDRLTALVHASPVGIVILDARGSLPALESSSRTDLWLARGRSPWTSASDRGAGTVERASVLAGTRHERRGLHGSGNRAVQEGWHPRVHQSLDGSPAGSERHYLWIARSHGRYEST